MSQTGPNPRARPAGVKAPARCATFIHSERSQRLAAAPQSCEQLRLPAPPPPLRLALIPSVSPLHRGHPSVSLGCLCPPSGGLPGGTAARCPRAEPPMSPRRAAAPAGQWQAGRAAKPHGHALHGAGGRTLPGPHTPSPGVKLASQPPHRCQRGTRPAPHLRAASGAGTARSKQIPRPLHPAFLCQRGFQPWAMAAWSRASPDPAEPRSVMQTATGAVSTSWTAAWQSGAFLLLLLLKRLPVPCGQLPGLPRVPPSPR